MFVKVRVPATSANLGPGFDVAGLAVTLYNTFTFELLDEGLEILGCPEQFANKDNLAYRAFEEGARYVGLDYKGLRITNEGDVPYTRGLGSSSTCIVAGIVGALRSPKAPCRRAVIFRSHGLLQIKQGTLHFPCAGCRQLPFCGLAIWGHLALQAVPSR